jgi:hypothetical protein
MLSEAKHLWLLARSACIKEITEILRFAQNENLQRA